MKIAVTDQMDPGPLRVLQKKRTTNFREDETKLLIQLWGSPQIQNKLYLTHRKAPVMRLLAANMQHRGFYRTPDEIKTRLRNLKCLYHRIKRSVQTGVGRGTVDPDWPHYKAMDEILSKKKHTRPQDIYKDGNIFDGPRCEDIKQEIIDEELDINDDMDSYTTNSLGGSEVDAEFDEEAVHVPPLSAVQAVLSPSPEKPKDVGFTPIKIAPKPIQSQPKPTTPTNPTTNIQIPLKANTGTGTPSIPFPLLILNGLPNQNLQLNQLKKDDSSSNKQDDVPALLKGLIEIQKENLEVQRQRLEIDKEKLDFQRLVGTQLLTFLPLFGSLVHKLTFPNKNEDDESDEKQGKNGKKRPHPDSGLDILKDSKILRSVLEEGIKKYMMGDNSEKNDTEIKVEDESDDK
ncbi:uncharacterized protein LOC114331873 isoform X1 [Diabrotica virgifera virgifera]|uniref:Myb/SANT-like DNA-binding domain-containing protein n=2 Tax=Diabrotica virgifera virgifera TaxID=50390 RepID=A0ABM5INI1_DIAVI|nr:uncharacterized protein LOC114331873 isoform X1 [Diabrotica virgifera virgifera]